MIIYTCVCVITYHHIPIPYSHHYPSEFPFNPPVCRVCSILVAGSDSQESHPLELGFQGRVFDVLLALQGLRRGCRVRRGGAQGINGRS